MQVIQTPGVGRVTANRNRGAGKYPIRVERRSDCGIILIMPVEVSHARPQSCAITKGRRGAGPAGVLPLRLGRKSVGPSCRQESGQLLQLGQLEADRKSTRLNS